MILITHHARFAAIHALDGRPVSDPESRLHGHTFDVTVRVKRLDGDDLTDGAAQLRAEIDYWLAHYMEGQNLSETLPFPASGARLAEHLYAVFANFTPLLADVEVIVDSGVGFTYTPDPAPPEES
jgi:hypothetical protein